MAYVDISGVIIYGSMIILLLYQTHILNQQMANSVISGGIRTYTKPAQAIQHKFILDVEKR